MFPGKWENESQFQEELSKLLNKYSAENQSDTPDFILAKYLTKCLENYNQTLLAREIWYGRHPRSTVEGI